MRFSLLVAASSVYSICSLVGSAEAFAQRVNYEEAPISYSVSKPLNRISELQSVLDSGETPLRFEGSQGYLGSLLAHLQIPVSSQVLVMSRTSLQDNHISPKTPRAIYFSDELHLGYVQGGLIEIAAHDPALGMVFYTMENTEGPPVLKRQTNSCLTCHGAARTKNVPGLMVRSVYPDPNGHPVVAAGSFLSTHRSPLKQRWGGWYVTGTHGDQEHLGNFLLAEPKKPKTIDNQAGQNLKSLEGRFDTTAYLSSHSDIVALMVLEHQADVYNILTQARFDIRYGLFLREQAGSDPAAFQAASEALTERLRKSSEQIVRAFLFCEEAPLTAPIAGTSSFAADFTDLGIKDQKGRSLRDFDLNTRMFKYPCSYLIETDAFHSLPTELKDAVKLRLLEVLTASEVPMEYQHLTTETRKAIMEILKL